MGVMMLYLGDRKPALMCKDTGEVIRMFVAGKKHRIYPVNRPETLQ